MATKKKTKKKLEKSPDRRPRKKTDVRFGPVLDKEIDRLAKTLGIPKNTVVNMAAANFCASFSRLEPNSRIQKVILDRMEKEVRAIRKELEARA